MLIVKVKKAIYENGDYRVLSTDQGIVTLYSEKPLSKGKEYKLTGKKVKTKYGKQFQADTFEPIELKRQQSNRDKSLFSSQKYDNF